MSVFKKFFVGASYGTLTAVVNRILLAVGSIIFARLLGANEFGVYINLLAIVNLFSVLCLFGVNIAFSALIPQHSVTAREKIPSLIISGLLIIVVFLFVFSGFVMIGADSILKSIYRHQIPMSHIILTLPWIVGVTLNTAAFAALYGFQDFRFYSFVNISSATIVTFFSITGVILFGLTGLVIGNGIAYGVSFIMVLVSLRKFELVWSFQWEEMRSSLKEMFQFTLPTFLSGLFVAPAFWIGNILIVQSGDISQSGYFGVANFLAQLVLFVPTTLAAPLVPIFSEVSSTADSVRFSTLVTKNVRMIWSITLPLVALLGTSASALIILLYGNQYEPSIVTYVLLTITNMLIAVESILGYVLIAKKKMWDAFFANLIWFCMFIVCAMLMIKEQGHTGFALAMLISYGFYGIVIVLFLKRHILFSILSRQLLYALVFTVLVISMMFAVVTSVDSLVLAILISIVLALLVVFIEWRYFLSPQEQTVVKETVNQYVAKYLGSA